MRGGLVLVRGVLSEERSAAYASAALINQPGFTGTDPVFAREVSAEVTARLRAALPGRPLWIIEAPMDPRGAARVLKRPAEAGPASNPACGADTDAHWLGR
jgi:hypothetical protein